MFYMVMVNVRPGVAVTDVQRAFESPIVSWCRIAPNVWVVNSKDKAENNANKIFNQLQSLVLPGGSLLVAKLDFSDNQGLMSHEFWNWANEQKNKL